MHVQQRRRNVCATPSTCGPGPHICFATKPAKPLHPTLNDAGSRPNPSSSAFETHPLPYGHRSPSTGAHSTKLCCQDHNNKPRAREIARISHTRWKQRASAPPMEWAPPWDLGCVPGQAWAFRVLARLAKPRQFTGTAPSTSAASWVGRHRPVVPPRGFLASRRIACACKATHYRCSGRSAKTFAQQRREATSWSSGW